MAWAWPARGAACTPLGMAGLGAATAASGLVAGASALGAETSGVQAKRRANKRARDDEVYFPFFSSVSYM